MKLKWENYLKQKNYQTERNYVYNSEGRGEKTCLLAS